MSVRTSVDDFGKQIYHERVRLGWTQEKLCRLTGYSQTTISAIERNVVYPNVATLQDIANALGMVFVIRPM